MRSLILLLILVNLGYFTWNLTRSGDSFGRTSLISRPTESHALSAQGPAASTSATDVLHGTPNLATKPEGAKPRSEAAPPESDCYSLGPFDSVAAAEVVAQELGRHEVPYNRRTVQDRRPKEYWVYIPPQSGREKALELSRKLSDQGITDYYIVATQDQRNAISLGLFDKPDEADSRSKTLHNLGHETRIDVRYENYPSYWLDLERNAAEKLQDGDPHSYLMQIQPKAVRHSCE